MDSTTEDNGGIEVPIALGALLLFVAVQWCQAGCKDAPVSVFPARDEVCKEACQKLDKEGCGYVGCVEGCEKTMDLGWLWDEGETGPWCILRAAGRKELQEQCHECQ